MYDKLIGTWHYDPDNKLHGSYAKKGVIAISDEGDGDQIITFTNDNKLISIVKWPDKTESTEEMNYKIIDELIVTDHPERPWKRGVYFYFINAYTLVLNLEELEYCFIKKN